MTWFCQLTDLDPSRFERADILKRLTTASRQLAELKGVAATMPNQGILINTLGLQEAKESSEVENIVTYSHANTGLFVFLVKDSEWEILNWEITSCLHRYPGS